jgi:hypothetical protein
LTHGPTVDKAQLLGWFRDVYPDEANTVPEPAGLIDERLDMDVGWQEDRPSAATV